MALKDLQECPHELIKTAMDFVSRGDAASLIEVETLVERYALDPRLHFLRGSLLATLQRYPEAHEAMRLAVAIAPGFAIARFQLGLLEFTSGQAGLASETWRPLLDLEDSNPLGTFVRGLELLMQDQFVQAIETLRLGIERNRENPPLNADMRMLIDRILDRQRELAQSAEAEPLSGAHLLLQQYRVPPTRH